MDLDQNEDSTLVEAIISLSVENDETATGTTISTSSSRGTHSNTHFQEDNSNSSLGAGAASTTNITTSAPNNISTTVLNPISITTASGNDTWELTWPIWHMLPVSERKSIAKENGFKSIGEFEESVILSRALNENEQSEGPGGQSQLQGGRNQNQQQQQQQQQPQAYTSDQLYELENRPQNFGLPILVERSDTHPPKDRDGNNDNDDNYDSSSDDDDDDCVIHETTLSIQDNKTYSAEEIENGGLMLLLPTDLIIHFILPFLSMDQYATCALVSPHWKNFTRTEAVYKELCKRCYLQQSKRKTLHVHRFNGSYHTMLNSRFRVKTGCGFYVLKCRKIKKIQRDMWTEIPVGVTLESTYYRYMNFFEDGTLLYALTAKPPHEMIPILIQMKEDGTRSHSNVSAILGKYEIQKDKVTVSVVHPWHHVRLELRVLTDGYVGSLGRFWALQFDKHWSSKTGDFDEYWSRDLVEYKVPDEPIFRFLRDWRL
jgi:F-box protein 9